MGVLPGHCLRLSIASAYWPVVWPSPYVADNFLHRGGATPSHLILPVIPSDQALLAPPLFKTTPPELIQSGGGSDDPPVWQITEDVIQQTVTVHLASGGTAELPAGASLYAAEQMTMTAHHHDPAHVQVHNRSIYRLQERSYQVQIQSTGTIRSTVDALHVDIQLQVQLNGQPFFQKSWLESIARQLL